MFIIKATGPGPTYAELRPYGDPISPRNNLFLNDNQKRAVETAWSHVKNWDHAAAQQVLEPLFEKVAVEHG